MIKSAHACLSHMIIVSATQFHVYYLWLTPFYHSVLILIDLLNVKVQVLTTWRLLGAFSLIVKLRVGSFQALNNHTILPTHVANLPSHMGQVMVGGPQDRSRLCGSLLVREASRGLA